MVMSKLHVVMFPWFAIGHITPYVHVANKLAEHGHQVSFFIPTKTQTKFNHLNLHPHLLQFIPLTVKFEGLPDGIETSADLVLFDTTLILKAFDHTQDQVAIHLSKLKPDFIFYDFAYWVPTIAKPLGIKSICMATSSPLSYIKPLGIVPYNFEPSGDLIQQVEPPEDYPGSSSVKPRLFQMKHVTILLTEFGGMISNAQRVYNSFKNADALCFRACTEIEGPFLDYLESQYNKPVLTLGLALTQPSNISLEGKWAEWLAGFEKGSVMYCAFGSECVLDKAQFQELVLGLEMTGLPFLARLKVPTGAATVDEALPEGFKERVKGRGVVYGGWVQQTLILAHPSVGCFVSHCGFGSMWESLVSNCQLVLVPHFGDQFVNSEFMSKGLKVGVEVERREEDAWFSRESLCDAVKLVMDKGSDLAEKLRVNHLKLCKLLSGEGLQASHINDFFSKLRDLSK